MAALRGIAAARSGFLLAALHSVAERVNPRKARPPTPHGPRVPASVGRPHLPAAGEECATPGFSKNQNTESCDLFHLGDIVYLKLGAMAEGARLASAKLW